MPGLHPRVKSGFLALRFQQQPTAIKAFAMCCVEQFEPFRAPLSAYDIQRREPESLPPDQRDNLMRYGYPYVGDAFDFHMTLTGQLGQNLTGRDQKTFETAEAAVLAEILSLIHI